MLRPRFIPAARFAALVLLLAFLRPDSAAGFGIAAVALCLVLVPDAAFASRSRRWPHPAPVAERDDFTVGHELLHSGQAAEAEPWLRRAVESDASDPDARLDLGIALAESERHEEALVHLEEATRLRPRDVRAHYRLGVSSAAIGRHFAAVHALREAVRLDPRHAAAGRALEAANAAAGRAPARRALVRVAAR